MRSSIAPGLSVAVVLLVCSPALAADNLAQNADDAAGMAYFEKHVRPLLIKHCYECHSEKAKELKGGLALDSRKAWQTGGDSGPAIEPGNLDDSLFISAIRYDSLEMPPKGKLPAAEIAIFEKWVQMGAPDPREGGAATAKEGIDLKQAREFWAFQLPEAHGPPKVQNTGWPRDEIDAFVLSRLEERELDPALDAGKATWLRRVYFDLTGLPPRPSDLDAFLADEAKDAREKVVDRLLASTQFGVHWGRHWLDVARYADSNGSDFNATFYNAWRYRNYVIDAFNADMPYDRFVREQLAGDLLPAADDRQRADQLIATTFLMIGAKMLSERDKEKLTMDVVDEQIDTVGKAFMGMTLGCARCHDHKFDPIPTSDYYALAGIFGSTVTLEGESQQYVSSWVETPLPVPPELARQLEEHKQQKNKVAAQLAEAKQALKLAGEELAQSGANDHVITVDDAEAAKTGSWKDSKFSSNFVGAGYLHDEKTGKGEKSITWTPNLPHSGEYEVRVSFAGGNGRDSAVPLTIVTADGEKSVTLDQTKVPPINKLFKSVGKFRFEAGTKGSVTLSNAGTTGYVLADAVQFVPVGDVPVANRQEAPEGGGKLKTAIAELTQRVAALEADIKRLDEQGPKPPMAMAAREAPEIGDCQICIRGEVANRGKKIERGFLQVVSDGAVQVEKKDESGRRELAEWLARPEHPLTARVMVNRIWQNLLGEGLVRSVDNFGHLGDLPSHPELLDTLAVNFVENGWSMKSLVRRIVLSRTYGMSTQYDSRAFELDPDNRLLWRANRKRLPAEAIRDAMFQMGGNLDLSPAESPVSGLSRLAIDNNANQGSSGRQTDGTRRSIYLPIVRNELPSFLTVFDFADPDIVTGRRPETNVPAQALFLMNSPVVKSQAQAAAASLLKESSDSATIADGAFRLVLGRPAAPDEQQRLVAYVVQASRGKDQQLHSVWSEVIQALFASTEFRMLD